FKGTCSEMSSMSLESCRGWHLSLSGDKLSLRVFMRFWDSGDTVSPRSISRFFDLGDKLSLRVFMRFWYSDDTVSSRSISRFCNSSCNDSLSQKYILPIRARPVP